MYVNKKQFKKAMKEILQIILVVFGVVWFCVFIYRHSGLDVKVREEEILEYVSYEYVVKTSPENERIKETYPQKVVYRIVEK